MGWYAKEIGFTKLMKLDGLDLLMVTLQRRVFPTPSAEARELLERGGSLSRVIGGPMTSYISRRQSW